MIFIRIINSLTFIQSTNKTSISYLSLVRDLSFILIPTLSLNLHIESVYCKTFKTLYFIRRITSDFKLSIFLKALYCAFVRKLLQYVFILWDPSTATIYCHLKRVQQKFLKHTNYLLKIDFHDYSPILVHAHLDSLANRKKVANFIFINKLRYGKIAFPIIIISNIF